MERKLYIVSCLEKCDGFDKLEVTTRLCTSRVQALQVFRKLRDIIIHSYEFSEKDFIVNGLELFQASYWCCDEGTYVEVKITSQIVKFDE